MLIFFEAPAPTAIRTASPATRAQFELVLQVIMFPSKSDGMFVPESLIFRSDSNGEDLEGYAGAGLYDSITMDQTKLKKVDYNGDRYGIHQHCCFLDQTDTTGLLTSNALPRFCEKTMVAVCLCNSR